MSDAAASAMDRAVARAAGIAEDAGDAMLAVVGPTASGKTELAVRVAEAVGGEIVSVDSVQIYRGFDIGSGKPSADEARRVRHHLVDALDPLDPCDASRFAAMASSAIADVRARGRRPILCGGTFLWCKALLHGLAEAPRASDETRARHRAIALAEGRAALHARLAAVDPESASRLHPNDVVRVSRALEVMELTGRPLSAWQAEHSFRGDRHRARLVALRRDPAELTARIEARARGWLAAGWADEVRGLLERGYADARAMSSVGYREVHALVRGEMGEDETIRAITRSTRLFARRQRTWLNHAEVEWL